MWEELARAIPVYFSSMLKFILGPVGGYLAKLNMVTTILTTVAGMMTVVLAFAFFGELIKKYIINKYFKRNNRFSDKNKKFVRIWRKYGLAGVAALTPLLLTPIGGALLAVGFGSPRDKLIIYMFVSASFWSVALTVLIYFLGDTAINYLRPSG
jgi:membrane protein DedA with SNARE-associated domain